MSRAFTKEDSGNWADPSKRYSLPARDDPEFDLAAAAALIEAARNGETGSAEMATGYYWGEPKLHAYVERIAEHARQTGDIRTEQLSNLFLGRK
jgi:hypothetical protein